jgi:hypothetical protein
MAKANPPIKKFKVGRITATVWRNDGEKGPYYSVNFDRSYKDDAGDWKTVTSFSAEDLPDLITAAEMAQVTIPLQKRIEAGDEQPEPVKAAKSGK